MVRFKNRYLLLELVWDDGKVDVKLSGKDLYLEIKRSMKEQFGDFGWAAVAMSCQVKYYNPLTNLAIVRTPRGNHQAIMCAITLIRQIKKRSVQFRLIHLGGTIKQCQKCAVTFNRRHLKQMTSSTTNPRLKRKAEQMLNPATGSLEQEIEKLGR